MRQSIDLSAVARVLLRRPGVTTRTLAGQLGVSQPSVSRLAAGKTGSVSAQTAFKLIEIAGGQVALPPGFFEPATCRGFVDGEQVAHAS